MDLPADITPLDPANNIWFSGISDPALQSAYALDFWANLGSREADAILWDVASDKAQVLAASFQTARCSGFAWVGNTPAAFAWSVPTCDHSATGITHFSFTSACPKSARAPIARAYLGFAREHFELLVCLIPCTWFGAIAFVKSLGFAEWGTLPKSCYIARRNKMAAGKFLAYPL